MTDYQLQANTRRCAATGRELRPGERFYGVLLVEGGKFLRKDYSEPAWQGAPEGALGFWKSRVAEGQAPRRPPVDDDLLLACFQRLEGDPDPAKVAFRYVLALLLMRRKRLRLEDAKKEGGREVMLLRCTRKGDRFQVPDPALSDAELESVQEDVFRVLGWE
jgi:hypothetical protein